MPILLAPGPAPTRRQRILNASRKYGVPGLAVISLLSVVAIEGLQATREVVPWGSESGRIILQLSYAYLGAWIFNLLVVELPARRKSRKWIYLLWGELLCVCNGDIELLRGILLRCGVAPEVAAAWPRSESPYHEEMRRFRSLLDSQVPKEEAEWHLHDASIKLYRNAERLLGYAISANPAFDEKLIGLLAAYLSADVFSAFRNYPRLLELRKGDGQQFIELMHDLPGGGQFHVIRQYSEYFELEFAEQCRNKGIKYAVKNRSRTGGYLSGS